jgi:hypothetical protein
MSKRDHGVVIEEELQAAGSRWRSLQPPAPEPIWRERSPNRISFPVRAAIGVVVLAGLLLAGYGGLGRNSTAPSQPTGTGSALSQAPTISDSAAPASSVASPPAPPSTPEPDATVGMVPPIVADGDHVGASGNILKSGDAGPLLCRVTGFPPELEPICPPVQVLVRYVDLASLPGWTAYGSTFMSENVSITGVWSDGVLAIATVTPTPAPLLFPRKPVPCDPPAGGWPTTVGADPGEVEAAFGRLVEAVKSERNLYSGYWPADLPGGSPSAPSEVAMVVGTVGDVATEQVALQELYPFSLCVVRAAYNAAELDRIAERAAELDRHWIVEVDPEVDRVVVHLAVFDEYAATTLTDMARMLQIDPLVQK